MKQFFTFIFLLGTLSVFAQQDVQYSQFIFNKLAFNPAYAGSKEAMTLAAIYRHQWQGIEGAPRTFNVQAHSPFFKNRNGLGLAITSDAIAHTRSSYADLSYAYRIPFKNDSKLAIGLAARFENTRIDVNAIEVIDNLDPDVPFADGNRNTVNFGIGAYYSAQNFYIGLSAPTLLKNNLYSDDYVGARSISRFRSYYLMAGVIAPVSQNIKFKPAMMISYAQNAPFELDLNASFLFMDVLWLGVSYRLGDSVAGVIQYQFSKQFKAGLAVDFTTSELNSYTRGSGEIMIEYLFSYEKEGINNIRFF